MKTECEKSDNRFAKPTYSVDQAEGIWQVKVEVPGTKKGDADVAFEDGVLEIKARRTDSAPESWKPLNAAAATTPLDYRLLLQVPETVAGEKIEARLEDGVLQLDLPVRETAQPRAIAVS